MKRSLSLLFGLVLATVASAQSATIQVTADGAHAITVLPNATVRIRAQVDWTGGAQFAGVKGDITVPGHVGIGSGFTSDFMVSALTSLGSFAGGSRVGFDINGIPAFFTGGIMIPPWHSPSIMIGRYDLDLAGVAPGTYVVAWMPHPDAPNVRIFPSHFSPEAIEVPTTLIGATITIIPTPPTLLLMGVSALAAGRRRR